MDPAREINPAGPPGRRRRQAVLGHTSVFLRMRVLVLLGVKILLQEGASDTHDIYPPHHP